jgi:hypothetical protein
MTNGAGCKIVLYWTVGGEAPARPPKLQERRPFLAPKVVICGVIFTGRHILVGI